MEIIYFLLPLALMLGAVFVGLFIWATKKGQYDDLDTPAQRILLDDERVSTNDKVINVKKESL